MSEPHSLRIAVNGRLHRVAPRDACLTLAAFLRERLGLTGTKLACGRGDCGACSVLVRRLGSTAPGAAEYQLLDACLPRLFQLDGSHVVTVEGLGRADRLSPVQQALVDGHASQCGYCTPGMVAALTACFDAAGPAAEIDGAGLCRALSGNLCRCTGYVQILAAARCVDRARLEPVRDLFPEAPLRAALHRDGPDPLELALDGEGPRRVLLPRSLPATLRALAEHPGALVVAGGTDLARRSASPWPPADTIVCISGVEELARVERAAGVLACGGGASWSAIARESQSALPALRELVLRIGSPQIRNQGTLGGSLVSAAATADVLPLLFVSEARLELEGPLGRRELPIADFYAPDGTPGLRASEILVRVRIPLPREDERLFSWRVSQRRDLDAASFTAAVALRLDGTRIHSARIALGGIGPAVRRLARTESFLAGRALALQELRAAGEIAGAEIAPLADPRAGAEHRARLARNALLAMLHPELLRGGAA